MCVCALVSMCFCVCVCVCVSVCMCISVKCWICCVSVLTWWDMLGSRGTTYTSCVLCRFRFFFRFRPFPLPLRCFLEERERENRGETEEQIDSIERRGIGRRRGNKNPAIPAKTQHSTHCWKQMETKYSQFCHWNSVWTIPFVVAHKSRFPALAVVYHSHVLAIITFYTCFCMHYVSLCVLWLLTVNLNNLNCFIFIYFH